MAPCGRVRSYWPGPLALLLLSLSLSAAEPAAGGPGLGAAGQGAQQQVPAGGPGSGGQGPRGGGGISSGGWKLADEPACREDVTRVCPKHSWANNLAVLECLQDVREL